MSHNQEPEFGPVEQQFHLLDELIGLIEPAVAITVTEVESA